MNQRTQKPGTIRRLLMGTVAAVASMGGNALRFFRGGYTETVYAALSGLGGTVSLAGVKVNRATAFKLTAFLRGVTLISNYVGKTPTCIYKGRQTDTEHPGHSLVRWWARKDWLSAFEFKRILTIHALVAGNGYGLVIRNPRTMEPEELRVLDPSCVVPYTKGGKLWYRVHHRNTKAIMAHIPADAMVHIRGIGWDELCGIEPLELSPDAVGIGLAQQQFSSGYLEKNGAPAVIAEYDQHLDDDAWNTQKQRLLDAVRNSEAIVSDAGGKIKPWNLSADQMQLLQSREFTLVDIANLLNLNASKLNAKTNTSYKSLEEDNRAFRDDTLDPWFCQFEIQFRKLLTEVQQLTESHHVEFERRKLARANLKELGDFLQKAVAGPWMNPNQALAELNLPDIEGGDQLYPVQGASPDAGISSDTNDEPDPTDDRSGPQFPTADKPPIPMDDLVHRLPPVVRSEADTDRPAREAREHQVAQLNLLARDIGRICTRLSKQSQKAAKRSAEFMDWLGELENRTGAIAEELQPTLAICRRDDAAAVAGSIIGELRDAMQGIYDTAKPDNFETTVRDASTRFEEAGSRLALKVLAT